MGAGQGIQAERAVEKLRKEVENLVEAGGKFPLKLLGPPPSPMKYADHLDNIFSNSIWNDIGSSGHNRFTGANYSAGPAHRGMPRQPRNC